MSESKEEGELQAIKDNFKYYNIVQARSKQNLSGQAKNIILRQRGVAMPRLRSGGLGACSPRKILKCRVSQIASGGVPVSDSGIQVQIFYSQL